MKLLFSSAFLFLSLNVFPQNIQLHWDLRHTFYPSLNSRNFPMFSFEYFKNIDTLGTGSFLLKAENHLNGTDHNVDQVFTQVSQSLKFWKPKVYISVTYSGGLGVTAPSTGYNISNSFGIGPAFNFNWKGAWIATSAYFRVNVFKKPSYDPQITLWFGKGFLNYKIFFAGSFVFWSQNRNQGDESTSSLKGKKIAFFGDPQIWFKVKSGFSVGSRISVYYHVMTDNNQIQFYPTIGLKYQF